MYLFGTSIFCTMEPLFIPHRRRELKEEAVWCGIRNLFLNSFDAVIDSSRNGFFSISPQAAEE